MASTNGLPLLFLDHQSAPGSSDKGQLNTEARVHVSRQALLKAARRPRTLKFITYSPGHHNSSSSTNEPSKANEIISNTRFVVVDPRRGRAAFRINEGIPPSPAKATSSDPFNSLAIPEPTRDEQFLLHYAFHSALPAFGESVSDKRDFAQSWITRTMEYPVVFYAQILGASTHYLVSSPAADMQNRINAIGLERKIQAIKALRTKIEQYQPGSSEVDEGMFLAILLLAIHGDFDPTDRPEPHPPSPLATQRNMHIYGRMTFGEAHINALFHLVEQKGGISGLDQHAYGLVVPLFDIVHSARIETPPRFPCFRQFKPILRGGEWKPDAEAHRMLTTLGKHLRPSPEGPLPVYLDRNKVKVLQAIVEITVALDHYCRGGPGAPASLDVLLNNCDWATHTVLSIPPYTVPMLFKNNPDQHASFDKTASFYEICRICTLLYIDMVILPTPPHTGIKRRHSKRMLRLIEMIQKAKSVEDQQAESIEDHRVLGFLTWATVIGAIAARFTEFEGSYSKQINKIARDKSWDATHPLLQNYLWFGPVCDKPARIIWLEARQGTDQGTSQLHPESSRPVSPPS